MFNDSKYTRWYFNIIEGARSRQKPEGYIERHHVIPKSIGGLNGRDNLVFLTAREHLLCHYLLSKMGRTAEHSVKLHRAFCAMVAKSKKHIGRQRVTGRVFEELRKSAAQTSALLNPANRFNPSESSEEYRKKMSKVMTGRDVHWRRGVPDSDETRRRKSEAGKKKVFSPEHRAALSAAAKAWRKKASQSWRCRTNFIQSATARSLPHGF